MSKEEKVEDVTDDVKKDSKKIDNKESFWLLLYI